jgi:hypothetical protein
MTGEHPFGPKWRLCNARERSDEDFKHSIVGVETNSPINTYAAKDLPGQLRGHKGKLDKGETILGRESSLKRSDSASGT